VNLMTNGYDVHNLGPSCVSSSIRSLMMMAPYHAYRRIRELLAGYG
jgi:hypothetical protein